MKPIFAGTLCLFLAATAVAQEEEAKGPWSGSASLGFAASTGNAESDNLAAGVSLKYDTELWHHEASGAAFRASATDATTDISTTTAERYQLGYKVQRDLSEFNYLFLALNFDRDLFSSYRSQLSETIGYGRRVLNNERHVLNLEVGVGAKQSDLLDGSTLDETIGRLGLDYSWAITDTSAFAQRIAIELGSDNTYVESVSELKASIINNIALALSYTIKNNSDVLPGTEKTDTFSAITLQYDF